MSMGSTDKGLLTEDNCGVIVFARPAEGIPPTIVFLRKRPRPRAVAAGEQSELFAAELGAAFLSLS